MGQLGGRSSCGWLLLLLLVVLLLGLGELLVLCCSRQVLLVEL
jgi:hypothetical protein